MLWSKLLSHLLLKPAKSDLEVFLRDRQFGIGAPQEGLAMTTALRAHLADHPSHVVACLDLKSAFGTIDRVTCMEVLRELCPHNPAWLDAVNVLLAQPALVINPYRNHLARTHHGLPPPPGGSSQHSSVLPYNDRGRPIGSQTNHLRGENSFTHRWHRPGWPGWRHCRYDTSFAPGIRTHRPQPPIPEDPTWGTATWSDPPTTWPKTHTGQNEGPPGLIILGEAPGEDPADPYPLGNDAFVQDHLRDVANSQWPPKNCCAPWQARRGDSRTSGGLGPHFQNFTTPGGPLTQSPPGGADARNVWHCTGCPAWHCLTVIGPSHHYRRSASPCEVASDCGGLGLPHLPTLALIARASCIATLPRAAHADPFRQSLVRQEGEHLFEGIP